MKKRLLLLLSIGLFITCQSRQTAVPVTATPHPPTPPLPHSLTPAWQRTNPGGGGAFTAVAAGPTGIILVASDLSGAYRSLDRGQTWDVIGSYRGLTSTHVVAVSFNPVDPAVLFLGTDEGIFRSGDGGDSFAQVLPDGYVTAVAVSPADPQIAYAARHSAWNVSDGRLYKSADNGRTWQPVSGLTLPGNLSILKLQLHPGDADTLYLLAGEARFTCGPAVAYRSADGGATWAQIGGGLGQIMDLALDETAPNTLFLTTYGDVWDPGYNCISDDPGGGYLYQSDDDGDTWTRLTTTQRNALIWLDNDDLAIRLIDLDGRELWESPDGNDWTLVSDISGWDDGWPENSFTYGSSFNGDAMTIGLDMSDPDALFWVDGQFVYGTRDDGRTFANFYTNEIAPGRWQSRGIDNIVTFDLVISPANPDLIYLAMPDAGCFRSDDGGAGWQNCNPAAYTGSWNGAGGNVMTVAADPARANVVWLTQAEDVVDGPHTLLRSDDFGAAWTASHDGLPASGVPAGLSVDPNSPTDNRTLFVTFGGDVYRSEDDGRTWAEVFACGGCRYTAVSPHDSAILFAGGETGLWRSLDGGDSWTETGLPEMRGSLGGEFWDKYWAGAAAIVFAPVDAERVYTAVFGQDRGLYRSDDGGDSWTKILTDDFLRDTAVSPADPQTIHAGSSGAIYSGGYEPGSQGFLVSRDGGQSWETANEGLAWPFVNVITLHPDDPDIIFLGSPGAGYYQRDFSPEFSYRLHLPVVTVPAGQAVAAAWFP
ncbi:MAG TPA: hypothetical protein EYH05_16780 [Anaerolineae bacterium]|nr:hypothetical protein [Anaerolineae bacterium]